MVVALELAHAALQRALLVVPGHAGHGNPPRPGHWDPDWRGDAGDQHRPPRRSGPGRAIMGVSDDYQHSRMLAGDDLVQAAEHGGATVIVSMAIVRPRLPNCCPDWNACRCK
ncbi:hypothetical protein GCM10010174_88350 [Kutzneria viridogrisea]